MRITITADGVKTDEMREMVGALLVAGVTEALRVGLDGPHRWRIATPHLTPNQYANVSSQLIAYKGGKLIDVVA